MSCARYAPVAAFLLSLCAGHADAAIIKYQNNAYSPFDWNPYDGYHLDLRYASKDQSTLELVGTTFQADWGYGPPETPGTVEDPVGEQGWAGLSGGTGIASFVPALPAPWDNDYALAMRAGDTLGPATTLAAYTYTSRSHPDTYDGDDAMGNPIIHYGIAYTPFVDGSYTFGVRFFNPDTNADHYGWITLELDITSYTLSSGGFSPYAELVRLKSWAWETEPNTPIIIPAPGMLGAVGLIAVGAAHRRRR